MALSVHSTVTLCDGVTYLLVYAPSLRTAALVDLRTGMAQIEPMTDMGPMEDVDTVNGSLHFAWWMHGAVWGRDWNTHLPWVPMPGFTHLVP